MSDRNPLAALALALALIGTLQAAPGIAIEDPWTRATAPGQAVAGGFMTLVNGGADDRLLRASSPVAKEVQIHNTSTDGGVMRMRHLPDGVAVPAGARVEFKPRALHLMFMELKAPIAVGSTVPVTLEFERAGKVETTFRVQATAAPAAPAPAAPAAPAGHDHHKMKHEH